MWIYKPYHIYEHLDEQYLHNDGKVFELSGALSKYDNEYDYNVDIAWDILMCFKPGACGNKDKHDPFASLAEAVTYLDTFEAG